MSEQQSDLYRRLVAAGAVPAYSHLPGLRCWRLPGDPRSCTEAWAARWLAEREQARGQADTTGTATGGTTT